MVATPTQIPEFIDALYAVAFGALSATTTVIDGGPLYWDPLAVTPGGASEERFLFIGARPDDLTSASTTPQEPTTMGTGTAEDIAVPCTVYITDGNQTFKPKRDAAKAIILTLKQAMNADQTLGGAVAKARVSSVDRLEQEQYEQGAGCTLVFTVTGKAFLR